MPFFIGDQLIQDQNNETILQEILTLPQPMVQSRTTIINPEQTCLVAQREILIASKQELQAKDIRYLGTKKVVSCLVLYLETDHECVLVHADNCRKLSTALKKVFAKLTATNAIRIKILGGDANDNISRENLFEILDNLRILAKNSANHLTITHQLLLSANQATEEDVDYYLFDRLLRKIAMLYRFLFNEEFDFSCVDHLSAVDFTRTFLYDSLPDWYQSARKPTTDFPLDYFIAFLNITQPTINAEKLEATHRYVTPFLFPTSLSQEKRKELFLALAKAIFCKEGKQLMLIGYHRMLLTVHLNHFVLDVTSGLVTVIPLNFTFPRGNYRQAVLLSTSSSPSYSIRHVTDTRLPILSSVFLRTCQTIEATVLQRVNNRIDFDKTISRLFQIPEGITFTDDLCEFIQSPDYPLAKLLANPQAITDQYQQGVNAFRENRLQDALALLEPTLTAYLALDGHASTSVGICYSTLASCYRDQGLLDKAVLTAEAGLYTLHLSLATDKLNDLLKKYLLIINRLLLTAEKLQDKALLFFEKANLTVAIALFHLASEKYLATNQSDKAALCLSTLASCYRDQGKLSEALDVAQKALELYQQILPADSIEVLNAKEKYEAIKQSQPSRGITAPGI